MLRLPRPVLHLLVTAVALLATSSALGAEPSPPDTPVREGRWYGWQSMIVDASAVLFTLPLAARENMSLIFGFVGPPAYSVGAPLVHFAHHNVAQGLGSLGLRLGAPPLVGGAASLVCHPGSRGDCFIGVALGTAVVAMVLDDAFLAHEHASSEPLHTGAPVRFRPTFTADAHGATAGLAITM